MILFIITKVRYDRNLFAPSLWNDYGFAEKLMSKEQLKWTKIHQLSLGIVLLVE